MQTLRLAIMACVLVAATVPMAGFAAYGVILSAKF
jgi:hypothetical protein